jgi:formylglycine-generating enzyme required for sulfatase activity
MGSGYGGITRSGGPGSFTYSVISGRRDMPVNYVTFYNALRFTNWMNNAQGNGDTETGAYTLLGGTPTPLNASTVTRNAGATIVLTSEDEWYKAAYYSAASTSYFDYPAGSNTQTSCATPTATANRANCNNAVVDLTIKGSYPGSASPYGTFDQGGNVWEWNEYMFDNNGEVRGFRGGEVSSAPNSLAAAYRAHITGTFIGDFLGFRVAMIPEPGTGLLVIAGLLGLARYRGTRR